MQDLDQRDRQLLEVLQSEIPLMATPFAGVGQVVDMSEKEVLKRIDRLRRDGVVQSLGAHFDVRSLGYRSCLVAASVQKNDIDHAAEIINAHPGVFQNYARNDEFNLWFSIAIAPNSKLGLDRTVDRLAEDAGCERHRLLPTLKLFKGSEGETADNHNQSAPELTEREITAIRVLQNELPLHPRPFDALGRNYNESGDELLDMAKELKRRGQLKKFDATIQPKKAAFSASAMGMWFVDPARVDEVGSAIANQRGVSRCYLRPSYDDWPYNIYATVHGRSIDECESLLLEVSRDHDLASPKALFPLREYKRTRIALFPPEAVAWEDARLEPTARSAAS